MQCLDNYIGVRALVDHCGADPSISELYIEDLEGMDLSRLASIEYGKTQSASALFPQLVKRAGRVMLEEVKVLLMPYIRTQAATAWGTIGDFSGTRTCDTSILKLQSCLGNLQRFVIEKVAVKFVNAGTYTLTLTDGNYTAEKQVTVQAGVLAFIDWRYVAKTSNVQITANTEGYTGQINTLYQYSGRKKCNVCWCNEGIGRICGISASYTVQCDFESILCATLPHLNMPLLYSVGIEVLKEWEASDRLNFLTIHGKEWAEEKRSEWQTKRNEFITSSIDSIARMLQEADRECVTCGGYSYGYTHP
jgi:hypothetical protein